MAKKNDRRTKAEINFDRGVNVASRKLWRDVLKMVRATQEWCDTQSSTDDRVDALHLKMIADNVEQWVKADGASGAMVAAAISDMLIRTFRAIQRRNGVSAILEFGAKAKADRARGGKRAAERDASKRDERRNLAIAEFTKQRRLLKYEHAIAAAAKLASVNARTVEKYVAAHSKKAGSVTGGR